MPSASLFTAHPPRSVNSVCLTLNATSVERPTFLEVVGWVATQPTLGCRPARSFAFHAIFQLCQHVYLLPLVQKDRHVLHPHERLEVRNLCAAEPKIFQLG